MQIRQSNFELLRILAMFLIVAHHYCVHGNWGFTPGFEINKFYVQSISIGGKLGVNIFILITGYFSCKSSFKWNGVISSISKAWFYSILFLVVFYIASPSLVTTNIFIRNLLPFGYWFVTTYVLLLIVSPFINAALKKIKKERQLQFLILFSIIAITPMLNSPIGYLSFFVYLYCIGAYIRNFLDNEKIKTTYLSATIIVNVFLILLSIATLDFLSSINKAFDHPLYFIKSESPLVIILSIAIFLYFKQINIGRIKSINLVSSAMFGVYLIHDNELVRTYLWQDLLNNKNHLYTDVYIHSIISILSVFILSFSIELIKNKFLNSLRINYIQTYISNFLNKKIPLD